MNIQSKTLQERWEDFKKANPRMRIRNAAHELNVSEVELLATQVGNTATRLRPEFKEILSDVQTLGKVMGLTRNDEAVHERKGVYLNPDFSSPHAGLFVNPDIDQRIFLSHWKTAFAVTEQTGATVRKSLQFFGKDGEAIHKIYLTTDSIETAFDELVSKYKSDDQSQHETTEAYAPSIKEKPDSEVDIVNFRADWATLKDTHDFFLLLRKYGLSRVQSLRLAPSEHYAKQIDKNAIITMLEKAVEQQVPIMVFIGNKGNIQIHTGEIHKLMWHENWYNILDPDFNMHLDMSKIDQCWVVRKPTEDGEVTAIEIFNKTGDIIVQFFGKRKPGIPELQSWKDIVDDLK